MSESINENIIESKQSDILTFTSQLKKHYYYESFIDPDKKFVTLLEKLIVK